MRSEKILFIHIPKTGGRSILHAIGQEFNHLHPGVSELENSLGLDKLRGMFLFCVVRNPWDRAVSFWRTFGAMSGEENLSFQDWVKSTRNGALKRYGFPFSLDQMAHCKTKSGEVLVNQCLRFETLDHDFSLMSKRIGITGKLPHFNSSEESCASNFKDYRDAYTDPECVEAVSYMERDVIEQFGYTFSN